MKNPKPDVRNDGKSIGGAGARCCSSIGFAVLTAAVFFSRGLSGAEPGESVVVVYNRAMPESRAVAKYYQKRRNIPDRQVIGFSLPATESMTRTEYREQLERPLLKALEKERLIEFAEVPVSTTDAATVPKSIRRIVSSRIRYVTLCYGVPVRISHDPALQEEGIDRLRPEVRRNQAAVDSELALLPLSRQGYQLTGPFQNRFYGVTNAAYLEPTNGILLVARLDGPSAEIARGLVDRAIEAETNGLWGRAYFDARGLTNGPYKTGDDWIRGAAGAAGRFGFETILDDQPETFPAAFPMSQIALYAGWYDADVSGPFARGAVEFMPGAFAYHLHSFSAASIRSPDQNWVGPLLAKGVTATMGCVDEPYLDGTPDMNVFFSRFLEGGFSFGEAACACQRFLSWQTTVVGDPLYRPFPKTPNFARDLHFALLARHSKWLEWSVLRVVSLNVRLGTPPSESINFLQSQPVTRTSAVLLEKLGELQKSANHPDLAVEAWQSALDHDPSPQQRIRVRLTLAAYLIETAHPEAALECLKNLIKESPDYPDKAGIYEKMIPLAELLKKPGEATAFRLEIERARRK